MVPLRRSHLSRLNYDLIPSRQVYLFPKELDFEIHQNSKRDIKLLKDGKFTIQKIESASKAEHQRFVDLYNQLYLQKYSFHNPQFNQRFIRLCIESGAMTFYGLKDSNNRWQAVVGFFIRDGVMTTPIVGYNTDLPQSLGLYRRLIAIVLIEAKDLKVDLNLSSGAPHFKILRGGKPFIEYTAIYYRHLPWYRQILIKTLNALLRRIGVPLMRKFKL